MKVTQLLDQYDAQKMIAILSGVPFLAGLLKALSEKESTNLLAECRLFRLKPGELIINKGEISTWLYVILKGGCFAFLEKDDQIPINRLHSNDVVGELTAILGLPRTAYVMANYDEPETLIMGMDFSIFSNPDDERMDISNKLLAFQTIQRTIFKRLRSVQRDLKHYSIETTDEIPAMQSPPHYMSGREQLRAFILNCSGGAAALQMLSDQLGEHLN